MTPAAAPAPRQDASRPPAVMVFGVGAFAHGLTACLRDAGARVSAYLTRDYGHHGASLTGPAFDGAEHPDPTPLLATEQVDLIVPMSIEWALKPWTQRVLDFGVPILCPSGEGLKLERERDLGRQLCADFGIPFPEAHFARSRAEAAAWVRARQRPFVIKNPLCAPTSPIHTIACESMDETLTWLAEVDDAEGIFLQEYLGRREVGHIALVSQGEVYSLVTNQEYKRAFAGNLGIVAGAPLGGLVEVDTEDRYGLARQLLHPLKPWFRQTGFRGPVQVTAMHHAGRWHVLEYNVRLGVTSGVLIARLLADPVGVFLDCARGQPVNVQFRPGLRFGCSVTLAGYGYPYVRLTGPRVPVRVLEPLTCDLWWNEVARRADQTLVATGHRLGDVCAVAPTLPEAIDTAYANIRRLRSAGSYYRTDVGQSLWPPGEE